MPALIFALCRLLRSEGTMQGKYMFDSRQVHTYFIVIWEKSMFSMFCSGFQNARGTTNNFRGFEGVQPLPVQRLVWMLSCCWFACYDETLLEKMWWHHMVQWHETLWRLMNSLFHLYLTSLYWFGFTGVSPGGMVADGVYEHNRFQ